MTEVVRAVEQAVEVIRVVQPPVKVVRVVERGPQGPGGPLADQSHVQEFVDAAVDVAVGDYFVMHPDHWEYSQSVPSTDWLFTHPLPYPPAVTVLDTAGEVNEGLVSYPSSNQVRVQFNVAVAGTAYCR